MDAHPSFSTTARRKSFQRLLLAWFAENARVLPWRGTRDLYQIWISEIMLQQTQVATVIGYYQRFLARFPTAASLAAGDEHDVLKLWEGLGYYRRARQLHAAAAVIVERHGGVFPETFDEVLALPGIGRYTAGAILSIGRDQRQPILEANTIRLLSRLLGYRGDPASSEGKVILWNAAEKLLPNAQSGAFNQALMEVGSLICTPREPSCLICPVAKFCEARRRGVQATIPPTKKKSYEDSQDSTIVVRRPDGRVLLRKRTSQERWAGLWDFPRFSDAAASEVSSHALLSQETKRLTGQTIANIEPLATIKHAVTRFRITLRIFTADCNRPRPSTLPQNAEFDWCSVDGLEERALSMPGRKIARLLQAQNLAKS